MAKRKQATAQVTLVDMSLIDCTELATLMQLGINARRRPTEDDLAKVQTYSSDQINKVLYRYYELDRPTPLENRWADCLGHALLLTTVSVEMAEYHCPKSRWLAA